MTKRTLIATWFIGARGGVQIANRPLSLCALMKNVNTTAIVDKNRCKDTFRVKSITNANVKELCQIIKLLHFRHIYSQQLQPAYTTNHSTQSKRDTRHAAKIGLNSIKLAVCGAGICCHHFMSLLLQMYDINLV
ncbi:uncharacterized protein LOC110118029 [Ceratitis capitata]|uniref:uncharacterized protein LOC110118029 n=1 Tax=Ceratitis capitata TaxID=7213 RepID=UPI000A1040CD|nr:uncharacterized protein LOC110118029 [Ceratitis capitata]